MLASLVQPNRELVVPLTTMPWTFGPFFHNHYDLHPPTKFAVNSSPPSLFMSHASCNNWQGATATPPPHYLLHPWSSTNHHNCAIVKLPSKAITLGTMWKWSTKPLLHDTKSIALYYNNAFATTSSLAQLHCNCHHEKSSRAYHHCPVEHPRESPHTQLTRTAIPWLHHCTIVAP